MFVNGIRWFTGSEKKCLYAFGVLLNSQKDSGLKTSAVSVRWWRAWRFSVVKNDQNQSELIEDLVHCITRINSGTTPLD
jgi:hypothetical protein